MRVLAISGSLRRASYNTALLRHAVELFAAEGAELEVYDELESIQPFNPDVVWGQAELRKVLAAIGARVVDGEVAIGHVMNRFDEDGRLNNPNLEEEMREIIRDLLAEIDDRSPEPRHTRRRLISVPAASENEVEG